MYIYIYMIIYIYSLVVGCDYFPIKSDRYINNVFFRISKSRSTKALSQQRRDRVDQFPAGCSMIETS